MLPIGEIKMNIKGLELRKEFPLSGRKYGSEIWDMKVRDTEATSSKSLRKFTHL